MFARMQAARNSQEEDSNSTTQDLLSRVSAYNQGNNSQGNNSQPPFYDLSSTDSPVLGTSDNFPLPAAPSPPGNFGHSHHPPGMNLAPIGSMQSNNASKPDQSANLLNLLKFSGGGGGGGGEGGQQNSRFGPQAPHGQNQPTSFDGPIPLPHASIHKALEHPPRRRGYPISLRPYLHPRPLRSHISSC